MAWRKRLRDSARFDPDQQKILKAACAASPWFWINAFGMTFCVKEVGADGHERPVSGNACHVPMITWLVQDEAIGIMLDCVEGGHDMLIDKSRDMGASWLVSFIIHWFWQHRPGTTFLEMSRKEDLVDDRGNMDCLFEKHRYIHRWQPLWLKPKRVSDRHMHLGNEDIGSSIDGESTNVHAGHGGRRTAIMLDEFALVPDGDAIVSGTADNTACRIFNSTPYGPGTAFTRIKEEKRAVIVELPWWRHPQKGGNSRQILSDKGTAKWTSPWYEEECKRRSKKDVAQNIDMDHGRSGEMFFDSDEIARHKNKFGSDPLFKALIYVPEEYTEEQRMRMVKCREWRSVGFVASYHVHGNAVADKPWSFWIPLDALDRPPQDHRYVFGCDISHGSGNSASVLSVIDDNIGRIVAVFSSTRVSPESFAEIAVFAGMWFGGTTGVPLLCWENNGPGGIFGRKVMKMGYPNVWWQKKEGSRMEQQIPKWGWNGNRVKKEKVLGLYRESLANETLINPCIESLDEALKYLYDESGALIPGELRGKSEGARGLHGDRVIADAIACMAREDLPATREKMSRPPAGSFEYRRLQSAANERKKDPWR